MTQKGQSPCAIFEWHRGTVPFGSFKANGFGRNNAGYHRTGYEHHEHGEDEHHHIQDYEPSQSHLHGYAVQIIVGRIQWDYMEPLLQEADNHTCHITYYHTLKYDV